MSSKPTLYLLAVVAVLLAFGYFFEFNRPGTKEADADAKRLVTFDRDKISGLTITDHDLKIELQQDDAHHWRLKSPVADRADHARIDEVMTELETARVDETFKVKDDDKSKLQELGLLAPHVRLLVTRNDNEKPVDILFGNDTAIEGKIYTRIEGTNQVAITSNELRKLLQKDTNAWRDHRAVDIAATDVTRFTIKNASGEIELQREGTHWKISKPLSARGDDGRINDLLSQATNLAVTKFVADDKADAATYGLATPRGVLTLYTADNAKGTELMIGDNATAAAPAAAPSPGATPTPVPTPAAPENAVYIRQPARQAIFTVPPTVEAFLTLKPNDLRDHALARINADTVDRVQITTGAGPAACTLARKDQGWTVNGQPANPRASPSSSTRSTRRRPSTSWPTAPRRATSPGTASTSRRCRCGSSRSPPRTPPRAPRARSPWPRWTSARRKAPTCTPGWKKSRSSCPYRRPCSAACGPIPCSGSPWRLSTPTRRRSRRWNWRRRARLPSR